MANTTNGNPLPNLPDDIITSIFIKSDSRTFARCRTLASFWKCTLSDEETVKQHLDTVFGPCVLLDLNHPMMLYPLSNILIWRLKTSDH
ncbi:hypothetical protein PIB30_098733, partial [Stylosanthes scabra]|nr:hypothetical protein [Stylosanthes scabra]